MIIIIASEVPDVARAIAGEVVNLRTGYEYYKDGVLIDHHGKPAPAYPTYTHRNKVYTVCSPVIILYDGLVDRWSNQTVYAIAVQFLDALAPYRVPNRVSFATVKLGPPKKKNEIRLQSSAAATLLYEHALYNDTCTLSLASIVVVPSPDCITASHRAAIPTITREMLPVYNGSIHCKKIFKLLTGTRVNPLSMLLSDFWCTIPISRSDIRSLAFTSYKINGDPTEYLHPVVYYPPKSDVPEFRTDLCSVCKSRLFDQNYALYNHGTNLVEPIATLCAICPLCVHCSSITEQCRGTWYTFTHPRNASDLLVDILEKIPENMHPVVRAICHDGLNPVNNQIIDGETTYAMHPTDSVSDWRITGHTLVYGKKIVIITPKL